MQWDLLRAEVLRQLVGLVGHNTLVLVLVVGLFWVLRFVGDLVVNQQAYTFIETLRKAKDIPVESDIQGSGVGSKVKGYKVHNTLKWTVILLLVLIVGYYWGYQFNAGYISGDISLIVTVSRIANFYDLFMAVFVALFAWLYVFSIYLSSRNVSLEGTKTYKESLRYKRLRKFQKVCAFLGIFFAVVIQLASLILCYVNIIGQK